MASISLGPIVDGIRGSIGGVTFSRASSGNTARSRPRPPRPKRERQIAVQGVMTWAAHRWVGLAQAVKDGWDAYGATVDLTNSLGQTYHPTGQQCYIWRAHFWKAAAGGAMDDNFPTANGLPASPTVTFDFLNHDLRVTDIDPDLVVGDRILFMTRRISMRVAFCRTWLKERDFFGAPFPEPTELVAEYDEDWPAGVLARAFVFWRFKDTDHRVSILQEAKFDFATV